MDPQYKINIPVELKAFLSMIGRLGFNHGREFISNGMQCSMIDGYLKNCPTILNMRCYNLMTCGLRTIHMIWRR